MSYSVTINSLIASTTSSSLSELMVSDTGFERSRLKIPMILLASTMYLPLPRSKSPDNPKILSPFHLFVFLIFIYVKKNRKSI